MVAANPLLPVALAYHHAGRSIVPIAPGKKAPSHPNHPGSPEIAWERYRTTPADEREIVNWYSSAPLLGIGIVCGPVSGLWRDDCEYSFEVIDVDAPDLYEDFLESCRFAGLDAVLKRLVIERSPGGAGHLGYACQTAGRGQVLARGVGKHGQPNDTLIEIRGDGQQVVVAPTPPGIHPDAPERGYVLLQGSWEQLPILTPDEREALILVAKSFNTYVPDKQIMTGPKARGRPAQGTPTRPGDKLNALADREWWAQLLEPHGWRRVRQRGDIEYWCRPGKDGAETSATLGACGAFFYVFSSNAQPFEPEAAYTPFAAYTLLAHAGDFEASAKALGAQYHGVFLVETPPEPPMPMLSGPPGWDATPVPSAAGHRVTHVPLEIPGLLVAKKSGEPLENVSNIMLLLRHHPYWSGKLWWDAVRGVCMIDDVPMDERNIMDVAVWFGVHARLGIHSTTTLEKCLAAVAQEDQRDLLQHWLHQLPPWDQQPRLASWLQECAEAPATAYGYAVSRLLPVSMVARALVPGCLSRYVVILEGRENTGKSSLVRVLASEEWHVEVSMDLESKDSHMIIQGKWLAELPELDALSRTRAESRLKAFITQIRDSWIPKYSNHRREVLRRTVFVGTTNPDGQDYLRGQSGNTRFLPITTGAIDLAQLAAMREQLFAEALAYYYAHPTDWWALDEETETQAVEERGQRRVSSIYEDELRVWLDEERFNSFRRGEQTGIIPNKGTTSWKEIAQGFLHIPPEKWADQRLQKEVATALHALGWERKVKRSSEDGKVYRVWQDMRVPF